MDPMAAKKTSDGLCTALMNTRNRSADGYELAARQLRLATVAYSVPGSTFATHLTESAADYEQVASQLRLATLMTETSAADYELAARQRRLAIGVSTCL
jgi:hypothetical protein